jgi:hypothetical protein
LQPCCDFFVKNVNWVSVITEKGNLLDRVEPQVGKTKLVCPSAIDAKNWNQAACSLRTSLLYISVQEICNDLTARDEAPSEGRLFSSGSCVFKARAGSKVEGYIA